MHSFAGVCLRNFEFVVATGVWSTPSSCRVGGQTRISAAAIPADSATTDISTSAAHKAVGGLALLFISWWTSGGSKNSVIFLCHNKIKLGYCFSGLEWQLDEWTVLLGYRKTVSCHENGQMTVLSLSKKAHTSRTIKQPTVLRMIFTVRHCDSAVLTRIPLSG